MTIELLNCDCMEYMATLPDKAFDLAIVDPPYGIGGFGSRISGHEKLNGWDKVPADEYFIELGRVSKNRIVWGGNYFSQLWAEPCRGFIVWNKDNPVDNFSSVELAWTSFDRLPGYYYYAWGGLSDGVKGRNKKTKNIHPTQKPKALYSWLMAEYAKPDQRILDTHLGSGSSAIAAHYFGCDFVGCELDEDYYKAAKERFDRETAQKALF